MKVKLIGIVTIVLLLITADIVEAQYGTRRRMRRRTAIVTATVVHSNDEKQQQEQQQQEQQQEQQQKTESTQSTSSAADHLPIGTVVSKLPDGCEKLVVKDVQYYHCGNDYYRAAYQESNLVYVTTEKPK